MVDKGPSVASPSVFLESLRMNRTMARAVVEFLLFAKNEGPPEIIHSALNDLLGIIDDTMNLLRESFRGDSSLGASRLPHRSENPPTPKEALEYFELTLDIMKIEVEALLKKPWATDLEYGEIRRRRDHVIKAMGYLARYYKGITLSRAPEIWTSEVEARLSKFLKIKP